MSTLSKLDAPQVIRAVYDSDNESLKVTLSAAQIELSNDQFLESRNAADDGDVSLIKATATDDVQIGDGTAPLIILSSADSIVASAHVISAGSAPSSTPGPALGVGGTSDFIGNSTDTAGVITVTAGTGATSGTIIDFEFFADYAAAPVVMITPASPLAAVIDFSVDSVTTSVFSLNTDGALADGETYVFNYFIIGNEA